MSTTEAQKAIPLDQHLFKGHEQEGSKVRPICSCGWRGRLSGDRDRSLGQFSSHTSRVWAAQR